MQRYIVSARGGSPIEVVASNWLSALGEGLQELGYVEDLDRLACEVLPNGTVIGRDVRSGAGFIVRPAGTDTGPALGEDLPTEPGPGQVMRTLRALEDTAPEWATSDVLPASDDDSDELEMVMEAMLDDPVALLNDHLTQTLVDSITRAPSAPVAWQRALEVARELIGAEAGAGLTLSTEGLRFVAAEGPTGDQLVGILLPPGAGVVGFCCRRKVSLIIQDAYRDSRFFKGLDQETGFLTKQIICVPVATSARVQGCLELINAPEGTAFGRTEIETVELVSRTLSKRLIELG